MDLFITVLAIGISGLGIHRLGQIFLMWNELGFATQHYEIDENGLVEWVERFGAKVSFVNLVSLLAVGLGVYGAFNGIAGTVAAFVLIIGCVHTYAKMCGEYQTKVGMSVAEAASLVSGAVRS